MNENYFIFSVNADYYNSLPKDNFNTLKINKTDYSLVVINDDREYKLNNKFLIYSKKSNVID